ncbi:AEC family transporter [Aestuariirhabdus sp. Z084]|uniref:AEC family transporter n=1 Tax=Aestuariirhabdus haliotis TaxID=2918751 RepID=UPI00201B459D|nr:AEC family transporter [Aestuariirhabdus haliotis]MCL6416754.1 AEC family transporter [Aestuariirhabdus haliotis]MCL6420781.1 AEC family transporter [Aestuariirhabdus haliotis]
MDLYLQTLVFTVEITVPIFVIVFLGAFLRRIGFINENFIEVSSKLVFNVTLPALLFISIIKLDLSLVLDPLQLLYALSGTLILFLLLWWGSGLVVSQGKQRGVFVQGSFRSNLGITGLALSANMYGEPGLAMASLLMAALTPLYNVLSVFALMAANRQGERINWRGIALGIAKNPLILSIGLAVLLAHFHVELPEVLLKTGSYFSAMTLPLALLGIGGTLSLKTLGKASVLSLWSSLLKLVALPFVLTLGALLLGFRGESLGIMFLMFASPTAAVSFVMSRAMGGDSELAASIILITTLGSLVSISAGIFILRLLQLA